MPRMQTPTSGTAIMVWVLPAITLLLGLCWLAPAERLQSSAFDKAKDVMPMHHWAVVFITIGIFKLACVAYGGNAAFLVAMCAGAGLFAWWTFLFMLSLRDPHTSLSAPVLPLGWTILHVATLSSLTQRRRQS